MQVPDSAAAARRIARWPFSLLEVVLALAVIAFGVVSVLALLPASMKASRDSVADTHSSQAAQHLIQTLAANMEAATVSADWSAVALSLPTDKPAAAEPDSDWTVWLRQGGMSFWRAGTNGEFFRVDMRRADADYSEFAAICRVWRRPVTISTLEDDGTWSTRTVPWEDAVGLNVEVSWPAQAPYPGRQKALFALNVFREAD